MRLVFAIFSFKEYIKMFEKFDTWYRTILGFIPGSVFYEGFIKAFDFGKRNYPGLIWSKVFDKSLSKIFDRNLSKAWNDFNIIGEGRKEMG